MDVLHYTICILLCRFKKVELHLLDGIYSQFFVVPLLKRPSSILRELNVLIIKVSKVLLCYTVRFRYFWESENMKNSTKTLVCAIQNLITRGRY